MQKLRSRLLEEAGDVLAERIIDRLQAGEGGFELERALLPRLLPNPAPEPSYVKLSIPSEKTLSEIARWVLFAMAEKQIGVEVAEKINSMIYTIARIERLELENLATEQIEAIEDQFDAIQETLAEHGISLPSLKYKAISYLEAKGEVNGQRK